MSKAHPPELKKFMDKKLSYFILDISTSQEKNVMQRMQQAALHVPMKLNAGRHVQGILRGFDPFMNVVLDESLEIKKDGTQTNIGMVVIRGNSIVMLESLDRL